ncbi:MAG TPA: hypothetical protein PLO37_12195 [Candidatus Hydrogenedentes bacterium]|nr:hypothetical protein [Candidatus Hydrogenedentota bacterium]HPG67603.1 hypothetical protein [Candidatus Hydrogenedentota bacterium]
MRLADVGWVWEGQGLDPGVSPSIFGVGEGAVFFGLRKVRFIFHPTTDLALEKLGDKESVVCDISKWKFRNCGERGGSECFTDSTLDEICAEAEKVGRFSSKYPNVTGCFFDDMKGLLDHRGHGIDAVAAIYEAVKKHNPHLTLTSVVYAHELDAPEFWRPLASYIDVVSFWIWRYQDLWDLDTHVARCRAVFPDKPIVMGCYLRDYPSRAAVPMDALQHQWTTMAQAIDAGTLAGFEILGTVLIDGHLEQATWVRDFIREHS